MHQYNTMQSKTIFPREITWISENNKKIYLLFQLEIISNPNVQLFPNQTQPFAFPPAFSVIHIHTYSKSGKKKRWNIDKYSWHDHHQLRNRKGIVFFPSYSCNSADDAIMLFLNLDLEQDRNKLRRQRESQVK